MNGWRWALILRFIAGVQLVPTAWAGHRISVGTVAYGGLQARDPTPIDCRLTDMPLSQRKKEGRLLMMSTPPTWRARPHKVGEYPSGSSTGSSAAPSRRIVISAFASNLHGKQQVVTPRPGSTERSSLVGRSVVQKRDLARELGYLSRRQDHRGHRGYREGPSGSLWHDRAARESPFPALSS